MKNLVRNLRQADQKEARRLGRVAMNASNEALAAAKAVEKAQREDNVSDRRFEGEYGNYEDKYEDLHDHAQDTRDDIMDAIQNLYESVEEHMDSRADKREDEDARREEMLTQRSEERHKLQDVNHLEQRIVRKSKAAKAAEELIGITREGSAAPV